MDEVQFIKVSDHVLKLTDFRKALIAWGQTHYRAYPWRQTRDPYRVLMAEIMLHRTQASQVLPIYEQFIAYYPDISSLAQARKDTLHDMLYSLGLRWRIDLIHAMAAELIERCDGQVPQERDALLSLPGVSDYIASAVRCFAWNYPDPIIDTNVVRVVGRLFGIAVKDSSRRNQYFKSLIATLVDKENPRIYNFALLDLADSICTKKKLPECSKCPVQTMCRYGTTTLVHPGNVFKEQKV